MQRTFIATLLCTALLTTALIAPVWAQKGVEEQTQTEAVETQTEADAYYNRGIAKSEQGDIVGAKADFTQVIRLKPKNQSHEEKQND